MRHERIAVSRADAVDFYSIEAGTLRRVSPGAAQQVYAVPATDYATEDLLQMKLGATSLWIGHILPVENEYPH
jgi:hypothetical protein